jgi:hypothetical protein
VGFFDKIAYYAPAKTMIELVKKLRRRIVVVNGKYPGIKEISILVDLYKDFDDINFSACDDDDYSIYRIFMQIDSGHVFSFRKNELRSYSAKEETDGIDVVINSEMRPSSDTDDLFMTHYDKIGDETKKEFFDNISSLYDDLKKIYFSDNEIKKNIFIVDD